MPSSANGNQLSISRGKFYFDRFNPITLLPSGILRFVGEVGKGDISISSTNKDRYTKTRATNNKIASVDTQQTHTIAVDLMEFTKENVALALLGTSAPITQSGNTITGEAIAASASAGSIYKLRYRDISAVTLKVGTTPLASTDIEIEDPILGLVRILPSATVGTGALTAAYTSATKTFNRIAAGQSTAIYGRLVFVGNPTSGPEMDVEIWKVKFMSSGVFSLLSDDFGTMSLTGEILEDPINHPTTPLYQATYRTPSVSQGTSITLADTIDGHRYVVAMVDGNITVTLGVDGAPSTTLTLADTTNGQFYVVTSASGNLTLTSGSSSGSISSLALVDMVDGHTYSLTSVNGALTATQIS